MVFYFTGTGNSLYAAAQLDARTCSIPQAIRRGCLKFSDSEIGIVCPVYGHEMPVMVQEFLKKAELKTDYLYLILTYGSFQGNAAELAEKVLAAAGKKADYIRTLLMPDNFLPDFDMEIEKKLDKNVEGQPAEIRADLAAHRRYREPVTDEQRRLHAEYAEGMNGEPVTLWADFEVGDACTGCGVCARVCPAGCFRLENRRAVRSAENCQACYSCIQNCPQKAIGITRYVGFSEKNPGSRYRNEHVTLEDIMAANDQHVSQKKAD